MFLGWQGKSPVASLIKLGACSDYYYFFFIDIQVDKTMFSYRFYLMCIN